VYRDSAYRGIYKMIYAGINKKGYRQYGSHVMAVVLCGLLMACGVKLDLPTEANEDDQSFDAGKTKYIRIHPDWSSEAGYDFVEPWDLIVGLDGYIMIANRGDASIDVLNSSGEELLIDDFGNDFTALQELRDKDDLPINPIAIAQDELLNVIIADSSNRLFVWNQYVNNVGIDSVAARVMFADSISGDFWVSDPDSFFYLLKPQFPRFERLNGHWMESMSTWAYVCSGMLVIVKRPKTWSATM